MRCGQYDGVVPEGIVRSKFDPVTTYRHGNRTTVIWIPTTWYFIVGHLRLLFPVLRGKGSGTGLSLGPSTNPTCPDLLRFSLRSKTKCVPGFLDLTQCQCTSELWRIHWGDTYLGESWHKRYVDCPLKCMKECSEIVQLEGIRRVLFGHWGDVWSRCS